MANARGVQHPQGAVAFGAPLLGIEGMIGGTTQRPIWLECERRTRKAMSKGWTGPLGRSIHCRRC